MKRFLIILAFGLVTSEKLDRTYLPPPGAHLSGGILGDRDAPLEAPQRPGPETFEELKIFGNDGKPLNFGDKIMKVPVTTTSYAFSQTTSYPVTENYQTTSLPINPITGLPINFDQSQVNYPYGLNQVQQNIQKVPLYGNNEGQKISVFGTNVQPASPSQGSTSGPVGYENPNYQQLTGYSGQNAPIGVVNIPGSLDQNQNSVYSADRTRRPTTGQDIQSNAINNQLQNSYPGQNVVIPANNQAVQYPNGQTIVGQQGLVPSTAIPQDTSTNIQPGTNGVNYNGFQSDVSQGSYSGQPIAVLNQDTPQLNQNQQQQYFDGNLNPVVSTSAENTYRPGTTPSGTPSYYNGVSSTTPTPSVVSPTAPYSSIRPTYRPERPQAAADRNAVILNYENIRTPNGYSYSFDTSNGIHADENGIVDNGTKAQGSYSYTGDDGKVYTVIYTADENGFQPRGDHLPTSPPIPEAIQKVIEQAARDKAAGIFDDGSYDEAKYGDKKYLINGNRRRPLNKTKNRIANKQNGQTKPIAGIRDGDASGTLPIRRPSNQFNDESFNKNVPEENKQLLEVGSPSQYIKDGSLYTGDKNNQANKFGNGLNMPTSNKNQDNNIANEQIQIGSKYREPFPSRTKLEKMEEKISKYPGSQTVSDGKQIERLQNTGNPSSYDRSQESIRNKSENKERKPGDIVNSGTNIDRSKSTPTLEGLRDNQLSKNNYRPQAGIFPQDGTVSLSDYINNANQAAAKQPTSKKDGTSYYYQPPNIKFEQTKFPTRLNPQVVSSTKKPIEGETDSRMDSTRRPFITPNIYNQNDKIIQSTTRRPFTTVGVNSPTENSYTDYEEGDDYVTDQDIEDDRNDYTKKGPERTGLSSPNYQQTTSQPQFSPSIQRMEVTQKETKTPGGNDDNSRTVTGYVYGPTTPMPSQQSRFASTESPKQRTDPQRGVSPTISSTTAVGQPIGSQVPSGTKTSNYKYETTGPVSGYSGNNVIPGYPVTGVTPGFPTKSSTPESATSQGYSTNTYRPEMGYSTEPTFGYNQGIISSNPSTTYEKTYSDPNNFQTGYNYGPPKVPFFTPSTPGVSVTNAPGTYQTVYQPSPGYTSTTPIPSTSESFIPYQYGNNIPSSSIPFGIYQDNYQNVRSQPTTIVSSSPGYSTALETVGSPGSSDFRGYEFGPSISTTGAPSTLATIPASYNPTGSPNTQGFSTTYQPVYQTTKENFVSGPAVDGFGRPISPDQRNVYPGFVTSNQGAGVPTYPDKGYNGVSQDNNLPAAGNKPVDDVGPGDNVQSTAYPEFYDQSKIIGEDFSGPKQPQRFDPKTGYHY